MAETPRSFKVTYCNGITMEYKGFDQKLLPASGVNHIALILKEDTFDVYVLDDPKKASDFVKFLNDEQEADGCPVTLVGVFKRV